MIYSVFEIGPTVSIIQYQLAVIRLGEFENCDNINIQKIVFFILHSVLDTYTDMRHIVFFGNRCMQQTGE